MMSLRPQPQAVHQSGGHQQCPSGCRGRTTPPGPHTNFWLAFHVVTSQNKDHHATDNSPEMRVEAGGHFYSFKKNNILGGGIFNPKNGISYKHWIFFFKSPFLFTTSYFWWVDCLGVSSWDLILICNVQALTRLAEIPIAALTARSDVCWVKLTRLYWILSLYSKTNPIIWNILSIILCIIFPTSGREELFDSKS